MKQLDKPIYHKLLAALLGLLLAIPGAWAQGGGGTVNNGYSISGEANPTEPDQQYDYLNQMPSGSDNVYWHVVGAATINGAPADSYPEGSLNANEHNTLTIKWDSKTDSSFVLQLRRQNDGQPLEILTEFAAKNPFTCTGHILYYGLRSAPAASGVTADQTVCAPPIPPNNTTGEFYAFTYDSPNCGNGFIWTIKYHTTSGQVYQEQWFYNSLDAIIYFSTPRQIPQYLYSTPQANFITPYNFNGTPGTTLNPMYGQPVTSIDVQCTGYKCGFWNCQIDDEMHFFYTGPLGAPGTISVSGGSQPFCRNQPISLSTGGSIGATGSTSYVWTASNSGVVFSGTGSNVTATLTNVPASVSTVTISVRATSTSSSCGTTTSTITSSTPLTLRAAPAPPTNMRISGACPATTYKTINIDGVSLPAGEAAGTPIDYIWSFSGPNTATAQFVNSTGALTTASVTTRATYIQIQTPTIGDVTVNVRAKVSDCGGPGTVLSKNFQIGNIAPVCPTALVYRSACFPAVATLTFDGSAPGSSYYISQQPYNITPAGGGTATIGNGTSPDSPNRPMTISGSKFEFDMDVLVTSPCPTSGSSGFTICTVHSYVGKFIMNQFCRSATADSTSKKAVAPVPTAFLYPNPTTGRVTVQPDVPTRYQWVRVRNLQGRVVLDQKATTPEGITTFDIQDLPVGLYEIQLFDGKKLTNQRLQKE